MKILNIKDIGHHTFPKEEKEESMNMTSNAINLFNSSPESPTAFEKSNFYKVFHSPPAPTSSSQLAETKETAKTQKSSQISANQTNHSRISKVEKQVKEIKSVLKHIMLNQNVIQTRQSVQDAKQKRLHDWMLTLAPQFLFFCFLQHSYLIDAKVGEKEMRRYLALEIYGVRS